MRRSCEPRMANALAKAVEALPAYRYAVLDGAHIDALPEALRHHRLPFAPLYLEASKEDGVRAGPYLVALEARDAIGTAIALTEGKPAATFWSWPSSFAALRRHLRGLNLVEIPNARREYADDPAYETVLFRHWDPNVLAVTLPVLREEQRARFLGDALGLAFDADEYGGVKHVTRPAALPAKPHGMLRLNSAQMEAITTYRLAASRIRIEAYLRDVAPDQASRMPPSALSDLVAMSQKQAADLRLTSERDVGLWSYLQLIAGGRIELAPQILMAFDIPGAGATPTECLERLVDATIRLARGAA